MNVISAYRDELNTRGHDLIDDLKASFPEWKIRRSLSIHLGIPYRKRDLNSGFHFSHHHPIRTVEKAVVWLHAARDGGTLAPRIHTFKNKTLKQERMKEALAALPKHEPLLSLSGRVRAFVVRFIHTLK